MAEKNKSIMSKAEEIFAANDQKTQRFLAEKESVILNRNKKTARLKALRLEKEKAAK